MAQHGELYTHFADILGTLDLDGCLNLAFSPRCVLSFYTFQVSICEQKGQVFSFSPTEEVVTLTRPSHG